MKKAIFYATGKGDTKRACEILATLIDAEIFDISMTSVSKISEFDFVVLASSTYGDGELAPAWKDKLDELDKIKFDGKKVALVGVGNQERHPDHFAESIANFMPKISAATLVGSTESNYKFNASKAYVNGKFIGLVLDTKGDANFEARITEWAKMLA